MMFILGTTFAGKSVIGFTYLIEFMTLRLISHVVFVQLIVEPIITILITVWYQFIDRSWLILHLISAVITLTTIFYLIEFPESPKFKYAWRDFDESKTILRDIAKRNWLSRSRIKNRFQIDYVFERSEKNRSNVLMIE